MNKGLLILLNCLMSMAICYAQETGNPTTENSGQSPLVLSFTPGAGYEMDISSACRNFSFPLELRLLPPTGHYNFAIGERFTIHRGTVDEETYRDQRYLSFLLDPYITYDQISTYFSAQWNIIPYGGDNRLGLFAGATYLLNVNTNGKVFIDAPLQGPWADVTDTYEWIDGTGRREYHCEGLLNTVSHALKLEAGFHTSWLKLSLFAMLQLTNPVNLTTASTELYYDRTHQNTELSTTPVVVQDGVTPYLPITLLSNYNHISLYNDIMHRYTLGFSLKAYLPTAH